MQDYDKTLRKIRYHLENNILLALTLEEAMFYKLIKFLFREIIFSNILSIPLRFLQEELNATKTLYSKKITDLLLKALVGLFLLSLLIIGLIFAFLALAKYLNEVLYSDYKGFLLVSACCIILAALGLGIFQWYNRSRNK